MSIVPVVSPGVASLSAGAGAESGRKVGKQTVIGGLSTRTCVNCEMEVPVSESCSWGRNFFTCHICKTNYNRHMERIKTDTSLQRWWKGLAKPEKVEWFKRNKATYEPNKKHAFDNAGEYNESQSSASKLTSDALVDYMTMDDWIIRQKSLAKLNGATDEDKMKDGVKKFKAAVMDKTFPKRFRNNQWLLGVYKGETDKVGTEHMQQRQWKRRKTIDDEVDHAAALDLAAEAEFGEGVWRTQADAHLLSNFKPDKTIDVPEGLARSPAQAQAPTAEAQDDIRREVLFAMQRKAQIADCEEMDDHEAGQAVVQRKKEMAAKLGVGRPKKPKSQLLSDVSRLVADRQKQLDDLIETKKVAADAMYAEVVAMFTTMPSNLDAIQKEVIVEVDKSINEIKIIHKAIGDLSIEKLVADMDENSENIKKQLITLMTAAFKTHSKDISTTLVAFKKAARKAQKAMQRTKTKAAAGGDQQVPVATKTLKDYGKNSVEAMENVVQEEKVPDVMDALKPAYIQFPDPVRELLLECKGMMPHFKWLQRQMAKPGAGTTLFAPARPAVARQILNAFRTHCPSLFCRVTLTVEHEALCDDIFHPQAWHLKENHLGISTTPYGCAEVRYLFEGSWDLSVLALSV